MDSITETLDTPLFLIAMPQVHDGLFDRSLVLLIEHTEEGSVGLIINRPTEIPVSDLLEPIEIDWRGDEEAYTFIGGPVSPELGTLLLRESDVPEGSLEKTFAISGGVRMTQDVELLRGIAAAPPENCRLLVGYAGWSAGQLEQEIERSDWLIAPFSERLVFSPAASAWTEALESIGVRPESLPSWSAGHETSN